MMAEGLPLLLTIYLAVMRRAGPILRLISWLRVRSGKDDPHRKRERFGFPSRDRPDGTLVWIHAASVGETVSVLPLIERFVREGAQVLLTTVTRTSAELAKQRLPQGALHQFACYDNPDYLDRFISHWKPDVALMVESEIWPAAFIVLESAGVPLALVNGRMSERSYKNWSMAPKAAARLFDCLDMTLAQSEEDAERLRRLGASNLHLPGNLKFDGPALPIDEEALETLRRQLGGRQCWIAALTHPGEDEIALDAHEELLRRDPELVLCLVPRHPKRAADVTELCKKRNLAAVLRSQGGAISQGTKVYIGDTIGEMGLFYALSRTIFLGGSFALVGGHNPLEVLRAGGVLVTGPNVANARTTYQSLWRAQAAMRLERSSELGSTIGELLNDNAQADHFAARARDVMDEASGAVERSLDELRPLLGNALKRSAE